MIDLLKNYKELQNKSEYVGSVRFEIAKKKFDVSFSTFRPYSSNGFATIKTKLKNYSTKPKRKSSNQISMSHDKC